MDEYTVLFLIILISFLPSIGYLAWVRKTERYSEEGWGPLLKAFLFGALISTFISALLEGVFLAIFSQVLQPDVGVLPKSSTFAFLVLAIVIAPIIEEGFKGVGVYSMRSNFRFVADGLVFGAAVGFGFGFVENTLYGLSAFDQYGIASAIITLLIRSVSSVLLHGSATAMTGFGVAENALHEGRGHVLAGYYLLAVLMHASFNLIASLPLILPADWTSIMGAEVLSLVSLGAAIAFAVYAFGHIRDKITELQYTALTRYPSMRPVRNR